jgi:hypothetical protein
MKTLAKEKKSNYKEKLNKNQNLKESIKQDKHQKNKTKLP